MCKGHVFHRVASSQPAAPRTLGGTRSSSPTVSTRRAFESEKLSLFLQWAVDVEAGRQVRGDAQGDQKHHLSPRAIRCGDAGVHGGA